MNRNQVNTQINKLLRYRDIMAEMDKHNYRDVPITVVWRKYIVPKFHISYRTLYNIMSIDIDGELERLQELKSQIS